MIKLDDRTQTALLGAWTYGKHREDIGDLEPDLFTFKKLYKGVTAGKAPAQLYAEGLLEGLSLAELATLGMEYGEYALWGLGVRVTKRRYLSLSSTMVQFL